MGQTTTRRRLLAGCGTALLTALAGCSAATPFVGKRIETDRTIDRQDAETLVVENDAGDVTVRGTDRDDLRVEVVKQSSGADVDLSKLELAVTRDGGRLQLEPNWTGNDSTLTGRPSMTLRIDVPTSLAVSKLQTEAGSIDARDLTGDLTASVETGDVTVRRVDGSVTADTETGSISIRAVETVGDLSVSTGDVTASVPAIDGDTEFSTETGDVEATLTGDVDAEIEASVSTGDVTTENLDLSNVDRGDDGLSATLGDGGPVLRLTTETGDVTIRREA